MTNYEVENFKFILKKKFEVEIEIQAIEDQIRSGNSHYEDNLIKLQKKQTEN
jgi:hypothetical protein